MLSPGPPACRSLAAELVALPAHQHSGHRQQGVRWMARPGLEPGAPRFSVVAPERHQVTKALQKSHFRSGTHSRQNPLFANFLGPNVGWMGPHPTNAAADSTHAGLTH